MRFFDPDFSLRLMCNLITIRRDEGMPIMKKKECSACAMEVSAKATRCPICGYEFPGQKNSFRLVAWLMLILLLWPLLLYLIRQLK